MKKQMLLAALSVLAVAGCKREPQAAAPKPPATSPASTNRVDIPANVRQNLGITFAKVESRAVAKTLRLPGAFELLPTARREYRAGAAGRVELLVAQFDKVDAGQPLARIESPGLRELQQQLAESDSARSLAQAAAESIPPLFAAHEKHHAEVERIVTLWEDRLKQLQQLRDAGGGQGSELAAANAALAQARADFAETLEKEAQLEARKKETAAQVVAARQKFDFLIASMASLLNTKAESLLQSNNGAPAWQTASAIEIRATAAGVVSAIDVGNGGYVEAMASVLKVVAPQQIRFRARGYQSDLGKLSAGLDTRVVPPAGTGIADETPMTGPLVLSPQASADSRTIDLFVTPTSIAPWAIDGVSGFMEITLAGGEEELAVPMSCVVHDGLTPILFRRDPKDPDKVIRLEADVGENDGRWVVISSGIAEGNEIVQDGAYQLLVATSGSIQKGGHFHPDGTFHESHEGED